MRGLSLAVLLCACSSSPGGGRDLATGNADLAMGGALDLAPRSTVGIACGAIACGAMAQYCCTSDNGATGDCTPVPKQTCAKSEFFCDGPEDCPPADPICCVASGIAQCASSCNAPDEVMCHSAADCGGGACCPAPGGLYALCLSHC